MDGKHFDTLVRRLSAVGSRRGALRAVVGGLAAAAGAAWSERTGAAPPPNRGPKCAADGRRCKAGADCCSLHCDPGSGKCAPCPGQTCGAACCTTTQRCNPSHQVCVDLVACTALGETSKPLDDRPCGSATSTCICHETVEGSPACTGGHCTMPLMEDCRSSAECAAVQPGAVCVREVQCTRSSQYPCTTVSDCPARDTAIASGCINGTCQYRGTVCLPPCA